MSLAEGGDEEIVEAVVIVVADGYAHAEEFDVETGFVGDVGEGAVVIVVVELGRGMFGGLARPVGAVDEEDVGPAIVVVIDESDTGAHGFGKIFFAEGGVVVEEVDAGLLSDVAEGNGGQGFWRLRSLRAGDERGS